MRDIEYILLFFVVLVFIWAGVLTYKMKSFVRYDSDGVYQIMRIHKDLKLVRTRDDEAMLINVYNYNWNNEINAWQKNLTEEPTR